MRLSPAALALATVLAALSGASAGPITYGACQSSKHPHHPYSYPHTNNPLSKTSLLMHDGAMLRLRRRRPRDVYRGAGPARHHGVQRCVRGLLDDVCECRVMAHAVST